MYVENGMEQAGEKRNMRTLEMKVDALLLYCTADSEDIRKIYHHGLRQLMNSDPILVARNDSERIDKLLADLGIPDHLMGYGYLQSALRIVMQKPEAIYAVTTWMYPAIAKEHNTHPKAVERSIRTAIEIGWTRCSLDVQQRYFGGKVDPSRSKPTNSEFIARACHVLRKRGD